MVDLWSGFFCWRRWHSVSLPKTKVKGSFNGIKMRKQYPFPRAKRLSAKLLSKRAYKLLAHWTLFDDFEWKSTQLSNSNEWRMKINCNYTLIKWSTLHDVWVCLMNVCTFLRFGLCINKQACFFILEWNNSIYSALFCCCW